MRSRPPNGSRTLLKTSRSASTMLGSEPCGNRLPLALEAADLAPDRERPVDEAPLRPGGRIEAREDGGVHLLVDARDARQQRRAHLRQRFGDAQRVGEERDREADVCSEEQHQPAVVVRQREVEEHHVVGVVVRLLHPVDDARHHVVVAVREHAALGRPGRPGRVDDREEVVLGDRGRRVVEGGRIRCRVVRPVRRETVEVVIREDVLQRRQLVRHGFHLGELPGVLADDRRPLRSARGGSPRRAPSSRRTRGRRRRRSARARSRRAPSRGCCGRGARRCRPCARRGRGSPFAYARTRSSASAPRHLGPAFLRLDEVGGGPGAALRPTSARAARSCGVRLGAGCVSRAAAAVSVTL